MEEKIEISKKQYDELCDIALKLSCLEECGVDNWDGYGDAMDMLNMYLDENKNKKEEDK